MCPGFVLTEEKFTDDKVEIFCYEKEYGSSLAWLVFCSAFVKRIWRHSLDNLKARHCHRQAVLEDREVTTIPVRRRLEAFLT